MSDGVDLPTPVLDDHLHLDPDHGRGLAAVEEFRRLGGTHLLVVNKPSWHLGVEASEPADFDAVFERTLGVVASATELLPGRAWPVLGVHPGLVSRLVDDRGMAPAEAADLICGGLDRAAGYVAEGRALALKSGRPHYEVSDAVWDASNRALRHALSLGAREDCAVQLHAEETADLTTVAAWATDRGLAPERVVKHYAGPALDGPTPSVMARKEWLRAHAERGEPFLIETDFIDDPDRPGAVMGPKTVPRRTRWLLEEGYEAAVECAHVETPARVYGVDTRATLSR